MSASTASPTAASMTGVASTTSRTSYTRTQILTYADTLYETVVVTNGCSLVSGLTYTVTSTGEAAVLGSGCQTYAGGIALATPSEYYDGIYTHNLTGMELLDGDLELSVDNVTTSLWAPDLRRIGGNFIFNSLSPEGDGRVRFTLSSLVSVSSLRSFGYNLGSIGPLIDSLTSLTSLWIQDGGPRTVENLDLESIGGVHIVNNSLLQDVHMMVRNITGELVIERNGPATIRLPELQSARDVTIGDCSSINLPSLRNIDGSFGLHRNSLSSFSSNATRVNGDLVLEDNWDLRNITLPELQTINGDLIISSNTNLTSIGTFHRLERVSGNVEIDGPISDASFPALTVVGGNFILSSTAELACGPLNGLYTSGSVRQEYECATANDFADAVLLGERTSQEDAGEEDNSESGNGNGEDPLNDASNDSDADSTALGVGLGVGVPCLIGLIVALMYFLWWRPRRRKRQHSSSSPQPATLAELDGEEVDRGAMLGTDGQRHEMEQLASEAPLGNEAQELPAKHGQVELGRSASSTRLETVEERHEMPTNETVLRGNQLFNY